ncbi:DUF4149 domain-containing protein [Entomobacter blattae]|uniref:TMEM205-like domain-containing protein n=1 Tax=Entomobacter blattae TaxID=2762277 RepID=A0A7H1NQK1_9PROT|nr:DUF4149 domain-containing protein [Entomobacter blattae]QNT78061.1 hypothetical protein JGUZn3_08280 [Entomobacter blattae]
MFTAYAIARALHVLAIVIWIGGVCMVTTILLPAIRKNFPPAQRVELFHKIESRFATQARVTTLIAGLSGFYMAWQMHLWGRFAQAHFWWMHAMVFVWLMFTLMLFVIEPFFLEQKIHKDAQKEPVKTYHRLQIMHWVMLVLSLITILGAVTGSVGYSFF